MSNTTLTCNCLVNLSLKLYAEPSFLDFIVTELIVFAFQKKEQQQFQGNPHIKVYWNRQDEGVAASEHIVNCWGKGEVPQPV